MIPLLLAWTSCWTNRWSCWWFEMPWQSSDVTIMDSKGDVYSMVVICVRHNGRHFPDDIFKPIFLNENTRISIKISLKFVPKVPINNIPALVQIMAWRRSGDKPLSEPMMVSILTHICVTQPQWVKLDLVMMWLNCSYWYLLPITAYIYWARNDTYTYC